MSLEFDDRTDFTDADRGFVDTVDPLVITAADGGVVFDSTQFGLFDGDCPPGVNPSLFRQGQLTWKNGLYEVTGGIYQIRGFDLSNMTLIEGDSGVVVVDPLTSAECAEAGLTLYRKHRGDRPVRAVIYTHSHIDHFGGVLGVLPDGAGDVPILAPEGFLEHAVSENVYAGGAMLRRGAYMAGMSLPRGADGLVGAGLGIMTSGGSVGLLAPTVDITRTGQEATIDGVRIVFQLTPGTEAPAEMNFALPDRRALCMAENANHTLHNILTLRGALVRDARIWSRYLDEAIELFADDVDVAFGSHHWPTWGRDRIVRWLSEQRDVYAYLHDQTLRLLNQGQTGVEIAEELDLPPTLAGTWNVRGYYGSVSHNVKAIYQRYLGWFDGHPTSLWQHPPQAAAVRYVQAFGGVDPVLAKAQEFTDAGDLRFAAELLKHAVFAEPGNDRARHALADVYQRLAQGAENALWRNFYLMGRLELLEGIRPNPLGDAGSGMLAGLTVEQLLDTVAIRVDGPRAAGESVVIVWHFTDTGVTIRTTLSNGALIQTPNPRTSAAADLELTLTKAQLLAILAGQGLDGVEHSGDPTALQRLVGLLDAPEPDFPVVTP